MSLRRLAALSAFSSLRRSPLTTLESAITGLSAQLEVVAAGARAARCMSAMAAPRHRTAAVMEVRVIDTCEHVARVSASKRLSFPRLRRGVIVCDRQRLCDDACSGG